MTQCLRFTVDSESAVSAVHNERATDQYRTMDHFVLGCTEFFSSLLNIAVCYKLSHQVSWKKNVLHETGPWRKTFENLCAMWYEWK